jgi:hypothetical protein
MSPISDTLSRFLANQSLLFHLHDARLAENQQIPNFKVFDLTWSGLEHMIYCTRGEHANHYATDAVTFTSTCISFMFTYNHTLPW